MDAWGLSYLTSVTKNINKPLFIALSTNACAAGYTSDNGKTESTTNAIGNIPPPGNAGGVTACNCKPAILANFIFNSADKVCALMERSFHGFIKKPAPMTFSVPQPFKIK